MDLSTICDDTAGCVIVITKSTEEGYHCLIPLNGSLDSDTEALTDKGYVSTIKETHQADETNVVYSEDVALETVVMTTTANSQEDVEKEDLHVPFMGQIVEVQEGDSRNDLQLPLDRLDPSSSGYNEELLHLSPGPTAKEVQKRNRDRIYKQQQRQNPEYKAKERLKSRERMKDKRKDPMYRETERKKDRVRRKQVREENTEFREKERKRDREYRKQLKTGEKIKTSDVTSISLRNNSYEDNMSDSESDNDVSVENCYTCSDTVTHFLGGRGIHVSSDHILSLNTGVGDSDIYSNSDRNDQFEMSFNS